MQQLLEPREMAFLGLRHPADFSSGGTAPENIELTLVDPCRPVLASMIDAQHTRDFLRRRAVSGQAARAPVAHAIPRRIRVRGRGRRSRLKTARQLLPITSEASRFQPASEIPHSDHAGSSQRTGI